MKKITALFVSVMMLFTLVIPAFAADIGAFVPVEYCLGDIDSDDKISTADARQALRFAVELDNPTDIQFILADYDCNEKITTADARAILRVAVSLDPQHSHSAEPVDADIAATWLQDGFKGKVCAYCRRPVGESEEERKALLTAVADDANAWAASAGFDSLVEANVDLENAQAEVVVKVDGIWDLEEDLAGASFDGLMTAIGDAVEKYVGDSVVTVVDETVYADGTFQNTAIKNVLFEVGAGFFYKLANLNENLVFGTYAISVDDETFDLVVKLDGSEENIEKVKSFADTVAQHISATVVDGNLVIDIKAPDALVNTIKTMQPENTVESLNSMPIRGGLNIVSSLDVEAAFGSQHSAVNRLCAVLNSLDGFVNKVLGKVTSATVTTMNDTTVDLLSGNEFAPEEDDETSALSLLIAAVTEVMSDDLLDLTVGEFANGDYYTLQLDLAVDMSNIGDMVNTTITETIYVNIHVFDDVELG